MGTLNAPAEPGGAKGRGDPNLSLGSAESRDPRRGKEAGVYLADGNASEKKVTDRDLSALELKWCKGPPRRKLQASFPLSTGRLKRS